MDHSTELVADTEALATLLAGADWDTPVPTCPGWSLLQLLKHVGRGHRWAAQIVRERRDAPLDPREVAGGRPPDDEAGALDWLRDSAQAVLDAVAEVGPDAPVWTFTGPKPAAWWIRRRLHESTVHRADAALALGASYDCDDDVAADGVGEWLHLMASRPRAADGAGPIADGLALALVADHGAAWVVRGTPEGLRVEPGTGHADTTVSGTASELLLAVSRRGADARVAGDAALWTTWLERTSF